MAKRIKSETNQKHYRQRSQSETVHSMMKRNLGSALRSRTPERQKKEMMLRALVHNISLLCDEVEGRDRARRDPFMSLTHLCPHEYPHSVHAAIAYWPPRVQSPVRAEPHDPLRHCATRSTHPLDPS